MPICLKCGCTKQVDEFYPYQLHDDHLAGECKSCVCARVRANRAKRRSQYHEYERARRQTLFRRAAQLRHQQVRRKRHPDRERARRAVAYAIRCGKLKRGPCVVCGSVDRVEAHHFDYSQPLNVQWLCFKCHREHGHGQVVIAA